MAIRQSRTLARRIAFATFAVAILSAIAMFAALGTRAAAAINTCFPAIVHAI